MDLLDVANYFAQDSAYDAYSSAFLFLTSTSYFDERGASASGPAAKHFTMSIPGTPTLPARNCVMIDGIVWIIGAGNSDGFQGITVNNNYPIRKSSGLLQILTPGQAALGLTGTAFHAHKEFLRDNTDSLTQAAVNAFWNIFCPVNETLSIGNIFKQSDNTLLRVRNLYSLIEGYNVCEADDLGSSALVAVLFTANGSYDPVAESYAEITANTTGVLVDTSNSYHYRVQSEANYRPGDRTVIVAASAITPTVGATLTIAGFNYSIIQVLPDSDSFYIRVRLT